MRGYSIISDEERAQILNTHRSFYDGFATGNVPSNQTPLTVEDLAQDKKGLQVRGNGEVQEYNNHIHESVEVKEYSAPDEDVSDVGSAFNFVSQGPGLGLDEEEGETCPSCGSPVEDCECEGHDHEIKEQVGIKFSEDIVFPDVRGWKRPNKGVSNREETAVMYKKDNVTVTFRQNQADENKIEISVVGNDELKEKLAGSIKRNELQDKINIFKQWAESLNEGMIEENISEKEKAWIDFLELNPSINSNTIKGARQHFEDMWSKTNSDVNEEETESMCEQCGLSESICECGMYEEIDEDLHEAFKAQREQILENFNRFKKFN